MERENKPTAKFLQARISTLSSTLIKRLENIFAAALQTAPEPPSASSGPNELPPSYIDSANEQFQLDIESTALVRAAEEIMVLTRQMKDLWLFGELDTIETLDGDGDELGKKMSEDVKVVTEALKRYMEGQNGSKPHESF